MSSNKPSAKKKPTRAQQLEALRAQSELDLQDQIRRLLSKRVGICSTAL